MGFDVLPWTFLISLGCYSYSSADSLNNDGICETNAMELHFGTRLQVLSKIEVYYTWCGHEFCYKTRRKLSSGTSVETFSEWGKKKKCCDGYRETVPGLKPITCSPICTEKCINALCSAPNTCTCLTGFVRKTSYESKPITNCVKGCVNGECTGIDKCTCYKGYGVSSLPHICMPVCENNCTNGFCIFPNKCECFSGFEMEQNICKPKCAKECINGVCTAPNSCMCNPNFQLDPVDKHKCNPVCKKKCFNGFCSNPNQCTCLKGYIPVNKFQNTTCKPFCRENCLNGECISPELCSCFEGYRLKSTYVCEPHCSNGCSNNQICIRPETCEYESTSETTYEPIYETTYEPIYYSPMYDSSYEFTEISLQRFLECHQGYECFPNGSWNYNCDGVPPTYSTNYRTEILPKTEEKEGIHIDYLTHKICAFSCSSTMNTQGVNTNLKCQHTNKLNIEYDYPCSESLQCYIPLKEDLPQHWNYTVTCSNSYKASNEPFTIDVQIIPAKTDEMYCQYCHTTSPVFSNEGEFQFSYCIPNEDPLVQRILGSTTYLIILCVCVGSLIVILSAVGLLWYKHKRRVDYALHYKERENGHHGNVFFERTQELVPDDEQYEEDT